MKDIWWVGLAEAAKWLSVGATIIVAIYLTRSTAVLWFFVIPAIDGYSVKHAN